MLLFQIQITKLKGHVKYNGDKNFLLDFKVVQEGEHRLKQHTEVISWLTVSAF